MAPQGAPRGPTHLHARFQIIFLSFSLIRYRFFLLRKLACEIRTNAAIRATHDRNSSRFRHGPHAGKHLPQFINYLRAKRVDPSASRPMLENVFYDGVFIAITNRRTNFIRTFFSTSMNPTRRRVTARLLKSSKRIH